MRREKRVTDDGVAGPSDHENSKINISTVRAFISNAVHDGCSALGLGGGERFSFKIG